MKYIIVDIETDGPIPADYSMLSLGACTLDEPEETWYNEIKPLQYARFVPETVEFLKAHGLDREVVKKNGMYPFPAMESFDAWLTKIAQGDRLRFVADNAAFDSMFVFWYLHRHVDRNQFGHSALSLTSLYAGFAKDMRRSSDYKKWRGTKHSHNALEDAQGNAQAMRELSRRGMFFG